MSSAAVVPPPPQATTTIFLLLLLIGSAGSETPQRAPSRQGCVHELVAVSPCLSYISTSPNNASGGATGECCDAFSGVFRSGTALCLCYLLWQPLILGFPLNSTRLNSLPVLCPQPFVADSSGYFRSLCSGSSAPPESGGDTGLESTGPDNAGSESDPSPDLSLAPETNGRSSTLPNSSMEPRIDSSAATQFCNCCYSFFLVHVIAVFIILLVSLLLA